MDLYKNRSAIRLLIDMINSPVSLSISVPFEQFQMHWSERYRTVVYTDAQWSSGKQPLLTFTAYGSGRLCYLGRRALLSDGQ